MVLEFAPRGDALHYVQKNGALEERLARSWALQLGDAVAYMHRQDIAHRDLKVHRALLLWDDKPMTYREADSR